MVGTMAAAAEDSPAESTGHGTKIYRAMGSPELAKRNAIAAGRYDPKKFLPEGGTNEIPITKKLEEVLNTVRAILMREFERVGALNQAQLHEKLRSGELRAQFAHNRQTR